jgi:hypothetical protein
MLTWQRAVYRISRVDNLLSLLWFGQTSDLLCVVVMLNSFTDFRSS